MTAKVTIGLAFDGASDPVPVRSMRLDRGLAHPVGRANIVLPKGVSAPEPGAIVDISITQGDDSFAVMNGYVAWRGTGQDHTAVSILERAGRMNIPMVAKSYGNTTAGQIISDLCSTADVPTATILPGATIPHMVLRGDATMLDHAKRLARMSGLLLTSQTSGELATVAIALPVPGAPASLDRARQASVDAVAGDEPGDVRVIGAGALGTAGPGASTLPLADPSLIASGPDDAPRTHHIAGIRTLADTTLAQLAAKQRRSARGSGIAITTPLPEDLSPSDVTLLPDENGLPIRLARLEALELGFSAHSGLLAQYRFSDLEAL
ncbi:hypothetical protein [Yoonia sp. SS1-5]|uniref:Uncharacterized protein n=1 Tax=Yoonia rhodophyticola TaxID=3137370 RepID=A0AAN0NM49_9RHOB